MSRILNKTRPASWKVGTWIIILTIGPVVFVMVRPRRFRQEILKEFFQRGGSGGSWGMRTWWLQWLRYCNNKCWTPWLLESSIPIHFVSQNSDFGFKIVIFPRKSMKKWVFGLNCDLIWFNHLHTRRPYAGRRDDIIWPVREWHDILTHILTRHSSIPIHFASTQTSNHTVAGHSSRSADSLER